jgi:hypothetical protein
VGEAVRRCGGGSGKSINDYMLQFQRQVSEIEEN